MHFNKSIFVEFVCYILKIFCEQFSKHRSWNLITRCLTVTAVAVEVLVSAAD